MSVPTSPSVPRTAGPRRARRVSGLRRAGFAAFVMLVVQFALGAAAPGSSFTGSGRYGDSMAMAALAAVGLLCYGTVLFLLPRPETGGQDG
jgi:hypothetical protein